MPSLRQVRQRLRSIQGTKQIMRAMQLVSASKLKRVQGRLLQTRSVMGFLDGLLERVLTAAPEMTHPLCRAREGSPSRLVLFTSDAGLCGSYNTNLIQLAESFLRRDTLKGTHVIYIGKKGYRYFTRRGYMAAEAYLDLAGRPNLAKAEAIAQALMSRFLKEEASAVHLLYSQFISSAIYRPTILQWLPISLAPRPSPLAPSLEYIFEPSPERIFEDLLPRWALVKFQLVMLEAFTSEHSARMIAMKNATDNAEELLKALTLQRNKIRQASITKEISEIVGTAEALK
ncbi:MAG: ATP synthase F1 subunit gamma [Candidatus Omnitrophica bacterium]|nr:ATP synthase F1 subunit gamma [Candidatus Omnitrophota bacterium]